MIVVEDRSREDAEDTLFSGWTSAVRIPANHHHRHHPLSSFVMVHGMTITSCSTSETPVFRASTVLCSTCLENSIDWWYQYQCYHPGDYITSGRSDPKDLLCLTFAYPIMLEYWIQIWTLWVITMIHHMNNTWFMLKHLPKLSHTADMASLCHKNHNSRTRRNGDVLNHRPVVETICIPPLHPQWTLNHNIGSNHTTWTHKWNFLRYHHLFCIQNVPPAERYRHAWHISNKRHLEQITKSTLPHAPLTVTTTTPNPLHPLNLWTIH